MTSIRQCAVAFAAAFSTWALGAPVLTTFSVDPASPAIAGNLTPDDLLVAGPAIYKQGTALGLQDSFLTGVFDNLADFSFGRNPITDPLNFSVDRVAVGLPGSAVFDRALPAVASAAPDVYRSLPPVGSNALHITGGALGLTEGFFGDDLDGLEFGVQPSPHVYFAIDRFSATNGFGAGALSSNLLVSPGGGGFTIYATNASMGLDAGDAIDGLVLWDAELNAVAEAGVDIALFSLDPYSPDTYTFTGLDYIPCVPGHMSPSDVCITTFTGGFALWATAADLGLRADDNVDALATLVPEPPALPLALVACAALAGLRVTRRPAPPHGPRAPLWPWRSISGRHGPGWLAAALTAALAWPQPATAADPADPGKGCDYVFYGWSASNGPGGPNNRAMLCLDIDDAASPRPYPAGTRFKLFAANGRTSGVLEINQASPGTRTLIGVQDNNPVRFLFTFNGVARDGGAVSIQQDAALEAYGQHYLRAVVDVVHKGARTTYQVQCPPFLCDAPVRPYD